MPRITLVSALQTAKERQIEQKRESERERRRKGRLSKVEIVTFGNKNI